MLPSFRFCFYVVVWLVVAAPAMAGPVTLAWDRNPEAFVAGYLVQLGVDPDRLDWEIDVGSQTWLTLPELPAPMRVYFRVIAYTASGLRSLPSDRGKQASQHSPGSAVPNRMSRSRYWGKVRVPSSMTLHRLLRAASFTIVSRLRRMARTRS